MVLGFPDTHPTRLPRKVTTLVAKKFDPTSDVRRRAGTLTALLARSPSLESLRRHKKHPGAAALPPATQSCRRRCRIPRRGTVMAARGQDRIERRLAAILAADVAGYSRLTGMDEEGTHAWLQDHLRSLVDPKIAEHRGR